MSDDQTSQEDNVEKSEEIKDYNPGGLDEDDHGGLMDS